MIDDGRTSPRGRLTGPELLLHLLSDHGPEAAQQAADHSERIVALHTELHADGADHEH